MKRKQGRWIICSVCGKTRRNHKGGVCQACDLLSPYKTGKHRASRTHNHATASEERIAELQARAAQGKSLFGGKP